MRQLCTKSDNILPTYHFTITTKWLEAKISSHKVGT